MKAHRFARSPHDHYVDEAWCGGRLFQDELLAPKGATILDPACGWGTILRGARAAGYHTIGSDLLNRNPPDAEQFQRVDFTKPQPASVIKWWRQADAVACNPPFTKFILFCQRCVIDLKIPTVAMIIPTRRLNATYPWIKHLPVARLLFMTPRPDMPPGHYLRAGGKAEGGKEDFAWVIFKRGHVGDPTWWFLHRDNRKKSGLKFTAR